MARVCVALRISPSEYRDLQIAEVAAITEQLNGAADGQ